MERFTLLLFSSQQYKNLKGQSEEIQLRLTDVDENTGGSLKKAKSFDHLQESSVYNSLVANKGRFVAYFDTDCLTSLNEESEPLDNSFLCKWRALSDDLDNIFNLNDKELVTELLHSLYQQYENRQSSAVEQSPISCLHELADALAIPGTYLFEIVWVNFPEEFPHPEECISFYGLLKRLQLWHKAKISLISIGCLEDDNPPQSERSSLDAWREAVEIESIPKNGKCMLMRYDVLWSGNLCLQNEMNPATVLTGFQLKIKDIRNLLQRELMVDLSEKVLLNHDIEVHEMMDERKIALHMLCPLNLQLSSSDQNDNAAKFFISIAQEARQRDLCFIASIRYDKIYANHFDSTKYDTESWHEYITSKDTTCYEQRLPTKKLRKRCIMIIKGCKDPFSLDVYIVKDLSSLSGRGAYEYLKHEHANYDSERGNKDIDIKWKFPLITKTDIAKAELAYIEDIQNQLEGFQLDDIFPADFFTKNSSSLMYLKSDVLKENILEILDKGDVEADDISDQSPLRPLSPSKWPERIAWLYQESNAVSQRSLKRLQSGDNHMKLAGLPVAAKTSCNDAVKNLSELLGLFKDSGEASAEQLKPIPVVADRLLKQLPSEDFIRKLTFDEAFYYIAHGVEYCVDSQNALKLDAKLKRIQERFISEDTSCTWTHMQKLNSSNQLTKSTDGDGKGSRRNLTDNKSSKMAGKTSEIKKKKESSNDEKTRKAALQDKKNKANSMDKNKDKNAVKKKQAESRSERHKRRLKIIVEATIEKYGGVKKENKVFKSCVNRLFILCKSFLKDLKTSEGLVHEMKRIAKCNVHQVVDFELRSASK